MAVRSIIAFLLLSSAGPVVLRSADDDTADREFIRAVTQSPALSAAASRTSASRARVEAAGRISDPELEAMASRMNGPMGERATMYEITVRQPLPKRGERAASRDRARAGVAMSEAEFALMAGELAADTAMALAESEGASERIRLLETQLRRLDAVLQSLEVRLAAGSTGRLADRLTVQTRVASMQLMLEEERRMAADALAEARGRLGLAPTDTLPAFAAPDPGDVGQQNAPAIKLAAARSDEADAMIKMARASARPMTAIGVRAERERRAMGDEDSVGLAFMSDFPWRSRGYARAEERAAEAERKAAHADGTAVRYRISAALTRVDRAERLAETARRLSGETLARINAEYDSLLRTAGAGGSGEASIFQLVELLEKATDTELQVIRADTAVRNACAELWRYVPADRFTRAYD